MEILKEILSVIGLPSIITMVVFIIRLESKIKINEIKIYSLDEKNKSFSEEVAKYKNKQDLLLEKLNDNIAILTSASVKHDLQLDNINNSLNDVKNNINKELANIRNHFDRIIEKERENGK